jgi:hypothetical protein
MKKLSILYFTILSFCSFAQKTEEHVIKICLEDAETGKNIDDAKVTLEGFEIPALTAKYDKQEKVYYFDEIPRGYNTVMAYHKKYNEKGFQNVQGLPKELKLRLYDPLNVSYNFESNTYKDSYQTIYVEDPYKIAIFSSDLEDYNKFKDYLYKEIERLNLDIVVVNPYLELDKNNEIPYCFGKNIFSHQKEPYPYVETFNTLGIEYILPLTNGYSTSEYYVDQHDYRITAKKIAFYFRKKNGTKFKRYNDPILQKIRTVKGITTSSLIYYKYSFEDEKEKKYENYYTKKLDKKNHFTSIDSSKVFFYYNFNNAELLKKPTHDWSGMRVGAYYPTPNEFLIYPDIYLELKEDMKGNEIKISNCEKEMFAFDQSIGLGILDQDEKISDCLKHKFQYLIWYNYKNRLKNRL